MKLAYLPLFNVDFSNIETSGLKRFEYFSLKRLDRNEQDLISSYLKLIPIQRYVVLQEIMPRWTLVFSAKDSIEGQKAIDSAHEDIQKLRFVLCLFGADATCPLTLFGEGGERDPFTVTSASIPNGNHGIERVLTLGDSHTVEALTLFETLETKISSRFRIAVDRLAMANERTIWEDQVIDLCIALENLLSKGSEISYRLSTYLPALTESEMDIRVSLSSFIYDFYNLRSRIVHGNHQGLESALKKFGNQPSETHFRKIKNVIRKSLKAFVSNPALIDSSFAPVVFGSPKK